MRRRVRQPLLARLRAGAKHGGGAFAAAASAVGCGVGIVSATGTTVPWVVISGLLGLSAAISVAVAVTLGRSVHLPDLILEDELADGSYSIDYCSSDTLREANALTKPHYRHEYVADELAESWRQKCPEGFVHILNAQKTVCASFGIIAIEDSFMKQFVKGRIIDNDLMAADILTLGEGCLSSDLYISGVVVRDPRSVIGRKRAVVMVWAMLLHLLNVYGFKRKRRLFALAVSEESRRLLRNLGFTIVSSGTGRRDGLDLYCREVSRADIDRLHTRIGDHSYLCSSNVLATSRIQKGK